MNKDRREFLIKSGCAALSMTALATQMRHFGLVSASAQKAEAVPTDYRALVCVFLLGGNDGNNTVVPLHNDATVSSYAAYAALRFPQGLAIPQNTLLPFSVPRMGGLTYGFPPSLGVGSTNNGLYELWNL